MWSCVPYRTRRGFKSGPEESGGQRVPVVAGTNRRKCDHKREDREGGTHPDIGGDRAALRCGHSFVGHVESEPCPTDKSKHPEQQKKVSRPPSTCSRKVGGLIPVSARVSGLLAALAHVVERGIFRGFRVLAGHSNRPSPSRNTLLGAASGDV